MRRTRHDIYANAATKRYVVVWTIHWQVVECEPVAAGKDLRRAMAATIERLAADGWQIESDTAHGFAFVNRAGSSYFPAQK